MEGAATIAKPQRWLEKPGTVGRAVRGMQVTIRDDDGNELPAGEVGNVYMEPDVGSFEYHHDPDATQAVHRGRAFTIGDIGYLDEDGYLFLCDRARDIIITGGVNVYPAEVEGVLIAHPAVADVAVIGIPDDEWGEQVAAMVSITGTVAPQELMDWVRSQLGGLKAPKRIEIREELPMTPTGKLLRREVRAELGSS